MLNKSHKVVSAYRRSSKIQIKFSSHQEQNNISKNTLILGEVARWSSYYLMLNRLLEQKAVVRLLEDNPEVAISEENALTISDWQRMAMVTNVLKLFYEILIDAERESAIVSDAIPLVKLLSKRKG